MQYLWLNLLLRATTHRVIHSLRSKSTADSLAYKIYGPSPTPKSVPIIVLHDCLGTKKNWENICKKLNVLCKKTVIAVDARNHGDSPYCNIHDYNSLACDTSQLLFSHFELEKCIIIGHSMGGRTAMVVALRKPSRIASLVIVDISPISTSSYIEITLPKIIDVLMSINLKGLTLEEAKAKAKDKILEHKLFDNEAEIDAILMNLSQLDDNSIGWKYNLEVLKNQVGNIAYFPYMGWKTFDGPTLFLAGKLSYCIPADDMTCIQKFFPAAKLLYIDKVSHNVHIDDPEGFLTAVIKFFDFNAMIKTEPVT